jgi:hypothetical protein
MLALFSSEPEEQSTVEPLNEALASMVVTRRKNLSRGRAKPAASTVKEEVNSQEEVRNEMARFCGHHPMPFRRPPKFLGPLFAPGFVRRLSWLQSETGISMFNVWGLMCSRRAFSFARDTTRRMPVR